MALKEQIWGALLETKTLLVTARISAKMHGGRHKVLENSINRLDDLLKSRSDDYLDVGRDKAKRNVLKALEDTDSPEQKSLLEKSLQSFEKTYSPSTVMVLSTNNFGLRFYDLKGFSMALQDILAMLQNDFEMKHQFVKDYIYHASEKLKLAINLLTELQDYESRFHQKKKPFRKIKSGEFRRQIWNSFLNGLEELKIAESLVIEYGKSNGKITQARKKAEEVLNSENIVDPFDIFDVKFLNIRKLLQEFTEIIELIDADLAIDKGSLEKIYVYNALDLFISATRKLKPFEEDPPVNNELDFKPKIPVPPPFPAVRGRGGGRGRGRGRGGLRGRGRGGV